MNENSNSNKKETVDNDLCPEYDLAKLLKTGVQGKYAKRFRAGTNLVQLEPDSQTHFN